MLWFANTQSLVFVYNYSKNYIGNKWNLCYMYKLKY